MLTLSRTAKSVHLTCSCGKRRRSADESPESHGPECCTCPRGTRSHLWGCLASYLDILGRIRPQLVHPLPYWPAETPVGTARRAHVAAAGHGHVYCERPILGKHGPHACSQCLDDCERCYALRPVE